MTDEDACIGTCAQRLPAGLAESPFGGAPAWVAAAFHLPAGARRWAGWASCEDYDPHVALPPQSLPDRHGALPADGGLHARAVKHGCQLNSLGTGTQAGRPALPPVPPQQNSLQTARRTGCPPEVLALQAQAWSALTVSSGRRRASLLHDDVQVDCGPSGCSCEWGRGVRCGGDGIAGGRGPQAAAVQVLEAAAVSHLAARLLAVENNLPPSALMHQHWDEWLQWRQALAAATTVAHITPQVLPRCCSRCSVVEATCFSD